MRVWEGDAAGGFARHIADARPGICDTALRRLLTPRARDGGLPFRASCCSADVESDEYRVEAGDVSSASSPQTSTWLLPEIAPASGQHLRAGDDQVPRKRWGVTDISTARLTVVSAIELTTSLVRALVKARNRGETGSRGEMPLDRGVRCGVRTRTFQSHTLLTNLVKCG